MIDRLTPLARNIALGVLFLLLGWFLWSVRVVLNPLILGYLLAFVVHPLVLALERRGWKRRSAVNLIFSAVALGVTLVALGVFFQARSFAREIAADDGLGAKVRLRVDQALEEYKDQINWVLTMLPHDKRPLGSEGERVPRVDGSDPGVPPPVEKPRELHSEDLTRLLTDWWENWLTEERADKAGEVGLAAAGITMAFLQRVFGSFLAFLGLMILLPIYTYFLLFELERIHSFVTRYLPQRERARLVKIGTQVGEVLANFFRGRLLVCVAKGLFLTLGLWIAGVDYALLLGMGTGFLSLIPFVGSLIGFVFALLVGMLEHSLGGALLRVGTVFLAAEGFENYFLIPKILGDSLGLHPVVVIFAIMAGGASLGMFGLLIALPLTASLVILGRELLLPVLADLADREGPAGIIR